MCRQDGELSRLVNSSLACRTRIVFLPKISPFLSYILGEWSWFDISPASSPVGDQLASSQHTDPPRQARLMVGTEPPCCRRKVCHEPIAAPKFRFSITTPRPQEDLKVIPSGLVSRPWHRQDSRAGSSGNAAEFEPCELTEGDLPAALLQALQPCHLNQRC